MTCVLFREKSGLAYLPTEAQLSHHHPLIGPPSTDLRGAQTMCLSSLLAWVSELSDLPITGPSASSWAQTGLFCDYGSVIGPTIPQGRPNSSLT